MYPEWKTFSCCGVVGFNFSILVDHSDIHPGIVLRNLERSGITGFDAVPTLCPPAGWPIQTVRSPYGVCHPHSFRCAAVREAIICGCELRVSQYDCHKNKYKKKFLSQMNGSFLCIRFRICQFQKTKKLQITPAPVQNNLALVQHKKNDNTLRHTQFLCHAVGCAHG